MSFDILLSSKQRARKIGGSEAKEIHTIPSIESIASSNKSTNSPNPFPAPSQSSSSKEEDKKYHYTLSFTLRFPYSADTAFVSYFYPFSYSDLQGWLNVLSMVSRPSLP